MMRKRARLFGTRAVICQASARVKNQ